MTLEVASSIAHLRSEDWNALSDGNPFLRHEFLNALHETGCASIDSGWAPQYLLLHERGRLTGAMPLYLKSHSYGEEYQELVPGERIKNTDKFDDPNLPGVMTVTVTLKKVLVGTEVNITQEGLPDVIPPEACVLGWQESLTLLAQLVEAEIPD